MAQGSDMACAELVELVSDYLERALPERDAQRFEAHLAECPGCLAYLEQMRTTIELAGRLRVEDLSPEMQSELLTLFRGLSPG
jgi:predicted anti-sigma-YlaC factor YlaD